MYAETKYPNLIRKKSLPFESWGTIFALCSLSKLFYTVDNIFCINNNKSAVKRIIVILLRIEFVYKTYKHPTNATYILSRDLERN